MFKVEQKLEDEKKAFFAWAFLDIRFFEAKSLYYRMSDQPMEPPSLLKEESNTEAQEKPLQGSVEASQPSTSTLPKELPVSEEEQTLPEETKSSIERKVEGVEEKKEETLVALSEDAEQSGKAKKEKETQPPPSSSSSQEQAPTAYTSRRPSRKVPSFISYTFILQ